MKISNLLCSTLLIAAVLSGAGCAGSKSVEKLPPDIKPPKSNVMPPNISSADCVLTVPRDVKANSGTPCDVDVQLINNGRKDLTLKEWDNRAVRAEHVAKAYRAERSIAVPTALYYHLAHTLGCTHNVGGVDRLVCRNENKLLDSVLLSHVRSIVRAHTVVLYSLAGAALHKRNMLVCCGVEYDIGAVVCEYRVEPCSVSYRSDLYREVKRASVLTHELLLYIIRVVLVNIENNQPFRVASCDLP